MRLWLALLFIVAQSAGVVRTADPIKRGLKESDFPRTIKVSDNVYTYEDFHAGDEKFTTTNMFVVTNDGVIVADGQGTPAATRGLIDAIAKVTPKPIKYVVIASDHGDHTAAIEKVTQLCLTLVSGYADLLSGRHFHPMHDLEAELEKTRADLASQTQVASQ